MRMNVFRIKSAVGIEFEKYNVAIKYESCAY
jgi:hypothetical protein